MLDLWVFLFRRLFEIITGFANLRITSKLFIGATIDLWCYYLLENNHVRLGTWPSLWTLWRSRLNSFNYEECHLLTKNWHSSKMCIRGIKFRQSSTSVLAWGMTVMGDQNNGDEKPEFNVGVTVVAWSRFPHYIGVLFHNVS